MGNVASSFFPWHKNVWWTDEERLGKETGSQTLSKNADVIISPSPQRSLVP